MSKIPAGLEIWPVRDSRTGNTVAWAYDPATASAYVEFRGGAVYAYSGVSQATVDRVAASAYVSKAISDFIKPHPNRPI